MWNLNILPEQNLGTDLCYSESFAAAVEVMRNKQYNRDMHRNNSWCSVSLSVYGLKHIMLPFVCSHIWGTWIRREDPAYVYIVNSMLSSFFFCVGDVHCFVIWGCKTCTDTHYSWHWSWSVLTTICHLCLPSSSHFVKVVSDFESICLVHHAFHPHAYKMQRRS
jgi:hypothetical protein